MAIKWTNEQVFKLLKMFEEQEFIWNTMLKEYKDRNKKHEAWVEIANAFEVEKHTIERKMRSLIRQYQRELNKAKSRAGHEEVSKWFAYKKMMFLKNLNKSGATRKRIERKDDSDETEKEESEIETDQTASSTSKNSTSQKKNVPKLKNKTSKGAVNIVKKIYGSRQGRDEFDVFGEHVAIKLRHLNNSYAKDTAQYKINSILYNAAMGEYDWPSNSADRHQRKTSTLNDYNAPGPSAVAESKANTPCLSESETSVDESIES